MFKEERKVGYIAASIQVRSKEAGSKSGEKIAKIAKMVENNSSFFGSTIDLNGNSLAFLSLYGMSEHMQLISLN